MNLIKKLFHRRPSSSPTGGGQEGAPRLSIEGIAPAPITPEADAAEQAAAALLDSMSRPSRKAAKAAKSKGRNNEEAAGRNNVITKSRHNDKKSADDYIMMAHRIREARAMEERACLRWLSYCEQQLQTHPLTPSRNGGGSLPSRGDLERSGPSTSTGEREEGLLHSLQRGLYDRQDIAEREGGELLRRWQHCLADVTVRLMNIESAAGAAEIEQN